MGIVALQRYDNEKISAIFTKRDESEFRRHIKVKTEDKRTTRISQPIKNLLADEGNILVSTHQVYDYGKFDRVECLGKKWQILETQTSYGDDGDTNALINPTLLVKVFLVLQEVY